MAAADAVMAHHFKQDPEKAAKDYPHLKDAGKILKATLDHAKQQGLDKKQLVQVKALVVERISQAIEKGKVPTIAKEKEKVQERELER